MNEQILDISSPAYFQHLVSIPVVTLSRGPCCYLTLYTYLSGEARAKDNRNGIRVTRDQLMCKQK